MIVFDIIPMDWHKRRPASQPSRIPVKVDIPDFEFTHYHFCNMIVTYDDCTVTTIIGRVLYNDRQNSWAVDGMSVAVRVRAV